MSKPNGAHPDAPTIKISGVIFQVPSRYTEGHSLTAPEAAALNQVLAENLRNNFAEKVKAALKSGDFSDEDEHKLQLEFAEYASEYEFNRKRKVKTHNDPVVKEARKLAKQLVTEQARKKNIDLKSLASGRMDELVAQLLDKNPGIMDEARERIASVKRVADVGAHELFGAE